MVVDYLLPMFTSNKIGGIVSEKAYSVPEQL